MKNKGKVNLIIILMIIAGGIVLFARSDFFIIRQISIEGNINTQSDAILDAFNVKIGENGFKAMEGDIKSIINFRYKKSEDELKEKFKYIKNVSIKYNMPGEINIKIEERKKLFYILYYQKAICISEDKKVIEVNDAENEIAVPEVKGIFIDSYALGEEITGENKENTDKAVEIINAIINSKDIDSDKMVSSINYIDVANLSDIRIYLDNRILVKAGEFNDLNYKIKMIYNIFYNELNGEKGILDYKTGANPVFIPDGIE